MESLIDKLKSLGVSIGKNNLEINHIRKFQIENVVKGEWLHDQLGDIYHVKENFDQSYQHGRITFTTEFPFSKVLQVTAIQKENIALKDFLFIDTETTGLSGGTGTMAFLVGMGYFEENRFVIDQYFLDDPSSEMSLMNVISNRLKEFKLIISFNGISFDIPLLKTRFVINRIESSLAQMDHLDLLHLSRKLWKLRLTSLRLRDIENEILFFKREEEEVPGWLVPQIYFDFIRDRDARPLKGVFYHNRMDVLSLAVILNYISELMNDPLADENTSNLDILSIARIFEKYGHLQESSILYQSSLEKGLPENLSAKLLWRFGVICKQHNNTNLALKFWQLAYERGEYLAPIEISKYYEHMIKDYPSAILWVQNCLNMLGENDQNIYESQDFKDKIYLRLKRIELKQARLNEKE
jgi:uncharacterized protein YprB with RNaseH-like and TPR domain